jgi:NAD(P)-dependent dehydrogenase (short-subunit alcohol dehydrogenase family)
VNADPFLPLTNSHSLSPLLALSSTQSCALRSAGSAGSIGASIADHPLAVFTASVPMIIKGGINGISRSLAMEYAKQGIRVNVVAPGVVDTPLLQEVPKDFLRTLSPLGQVASSEDIAEAVFYLTQASQVTGEVLYVDGGAHRGRW